MSGIPADAVESRRTPEFDADSIPAGLLRAHTTRAGTWGEIRVLEGELLYRVLEPEPRETVLTPAHPGVVEPQVPHEVAPRGAVRFYVAFFRRPQNPDV